MKGYYQLIRHNGNLDLFRSLEMSILAMANDYPFHIHVEGLRGTGKTTIMRAAREILPPIERIKNCLYNCDPKRPHCPEHRHLSPAEIAEIGVETVPRPFLEISHSAKIGTIVGSIDLQKLTDKMQPAAALLPGTIPQAHRGIIFIDEINRLADTSPELADVLLDVMGTKPGRIQIEETGLPTISLPVQVTVWAASNPDEEPGALMQVRRQLSDRFDVLVNMGRPSDYQTVINILEGRATADPKYGPRPAMAFNQRLSAIDVDDRIRQLLAIIYVDFGLESLRAVEGLQTAATLAAAIDGRRKVTVQDLIQVTPLVLGHRLDHATITSILQYLQSMDGGRVVEPPLIVSGPPPAAKPKAAGNNQTVHYSQTIENKGLLSQLWDEVKSAFGGQSKPAPSPSPVKRIANISSAPASSSEAQIMFNKVSQVAAPPQVATALADLPAECYVNSGEKK